MWVAGSTTCAPLVHAGSTLAPNFMFGEVVDRIIIPMH